MGHDEAVAIFRAELDRGRLHHAWLVTGPEGVGKALFASRAALRVLAHGAGLPLSSPGLVLPEGHPTEKLADAGSHPDLMRLERLVRDGGTDRARNINVDQVRGLQRLFSTTPSMSAWRAVIIDSIDDLEPSAANALLKQLEEPPPCTIFFLISHRPATLLPTIRSRCRLLRLAPLADDVMAAVLRTLLPEASEEDVEQLVRIGDGSPGRAIGFHGLDIAALDFEMRRLAEEGDPSGTRRSALARSLALKSAQNRYEAFLMRAPSLISEVARNRTDGELDQAILIWEKASSLAREARRHSLDPHSVVFELGGALAELAGAEQRAA